MLVRGEGPGAGEQRLQAALVVIAGGQGRLRHPPIIGGALPQLVPCSLFLVPSSLYPVLMNYRESIDYLLSFADFERSGRFQDRPDVEPVLALLGRLGDPHLGRATIHIAGSKGKGI